MSPTWNNYYVAIVHVEKFTLSWLVQQIGGPSGRNRLEVLVAVGRQGAGSKAIFLRLFCIIMALNNSYKLGLALFALGIIIFFGQRDVLGYLNIIASLLVPPESGFYNVILQSYYVIYALSVILIITGVIIFYKGRTKTSNLTSSSTRTER